MSKQITKVVVTGGPCAGKSTAMSWIQETFTKKGYHVLFVPETATELITGGVAPWDFANAVDFQRTLMELQRWKEQSFGAAARKMDDERVLIVCDRALLDNKAYMTPEVFAEVLRQLNADEFAMRDSYDAVFHLVTAAKGAEQFYTLSNNKARYESVADAVDIDDKIMASWTGHPHLRVIDNTTEFAEKMIRLIAEISSFLGEPGPYEVKRKFLIQYPDEAYLESLPNCSKVEIIQTYLKSNDGSEVRIRQRGQHGHYIYTKTIKRKVAPKKRIETETRLTQDEYLNLLIDADTTLRQIRKTRYCLTMRHHCFEIDVYGFWPEQAIMCVELHDENEEIEIPAFVNVIREVTGDDNYTNFAMAHR